MKKQAAFVVLLACVFLLSACARPCCTLAEIPAELPECMDQTVRVDGRSDLLCVIVTDSPYGPFDEVAIYHIDDARRYRKIYSETGGVGVFGGLEFSPNGRYMSLSWSEEGHPYVTFYNTDAFLQYGAGERAGLSQLGMYDLQYVNALNDDGTATFITWRPLGSEDGDEDAQDCEKHSAKCQYTLDLENGDITAVNSLQVIKGY